VLSEDAFRKGMLPQGAKREDYDAKNLSTEVWESLQANFNEETQV